LSEKNSEMNAPPPPKISAKSTIAAADACTAARMPIISATNTTKTSPSRNIVAVIRTVNPRSGAYLVRAIRHLRSRQAPRPFAASAWT
jgi:hypothetical protein